MRERSEWDARPHPRLGPHAYHDLHELPDGLDPEQPVAVDLRVRPARRVAASLLQRLGARDVIHVVDGGVPRWEREGWPIER